jgi:hypothetical protein
LAAQKQVFDLVQAGDDGQQGGATPQKVKVKLPQEWKIRQKRVCKNGICPDAELGEAGEWLFGAPCHLNNQVPILIIR